MKVYIDMSLLRLKDICKVDLVTIQYADYFIFIV
jgi:hypothetical protein